jgi:hypothetical protein
VAKPHCLVFQKARDKKVKNFRIDTKSKLDNFLKLIVEKSAQDAARALAEDERERQENMSQGLKGLRASDSQGEVEEAEGEEEEVVKVVTKKQGAEDTPEVPTEKQDVEAKLEKEITLIDLTDSLNLLRSGKSLKDEEVKTNIKAFFDQLSTAERQSMYVYINALAGIMTGTETGKEAADPADVGIQTQEKPEEEVEDISVTAQVEKGTEESPIIVGEVARKAGVHRRLRELMRR